MNKFRKGDEVIVTTGKDAGKTGTIREVFLKDKRVAKVIVTGVAIVHKHTKPNPQAGIEGGIIEQERAIDVSNIALVDANGKPSRSSIEERDGKKVRVLKTTGAIV
jgi:large subunit ribosomal protein L24